MNQAIATHPNTGGMSDTSHGIELHHPDFGWVPVSMVNPTQFAVTTPEAHVWFALDNPVASMWPMRNAGKFVRWIKRVAA